MFSFSVMSLGFVSVFFFWLSMNFIMISESGSSYLLGHGSE